MFTGQILNYQESLLKILVQDLIKLSENSIYQSYIYFKVLLLLFLNYSLLFLLLTVKVLNKLSIIIKMYVYCKV